MNQKDIPGFEGLYAVTDDGRVWSYRRKIFLKPGLDRYGYQIVNLYKDKKGKTTLVHQLVAKVFVPNPENKPQCNHINEIKTDNRAENLEWVTAKENINHGTRNKRASDTAAKPVYCVELDTANISNFKIIPYLQSNEEPGLRLLTKEEKLFFSQKISELNDIISSESKLKDAEMRFYSQGSISFLNPFYNGLTAKLYGKKWFPSFVSKNHRYYQLHYIQCESHRDVLLYNLKKFLDI